MRGRRCKDVCSAQHSSRGGRQQGRQAAAAAAAGTTCVNASACTLQVCLTCYGMAHHALCASQRLPATGSCRQRRHGQRPLLTISGPHNCRARQPHGFVVQLALLLCYPGALDRLLGLASSHAPNPLLRARVCWPLGLRGEAVVVLLSMRSTPRQHSSCTCRRCRHRHRRASNPPALLLCRCNHGGLLLAAE